MSYKSFFYKMMGNHQKMLSNWQMLKEKGIMVEEANDWIKWYTKRIEADKKIIDNIPKNT